MLPSHQQFAFKAEDLVLNYLISKGCEGYKAETKELQFEESHWGIKNPFTDYGSVLSFGF